MSNPFLGEIRMVGFNFNLRGWALCNVQLLPISQNTALFSLLGTTYGGDGVTTFALPDLRSRVPIHQGTGTGLSAYVMGQSAGTENVTLLTTQIPAHVHVNTLPVANVAPTTNNPIGAVPAHRSIPTSTRLISTLPPAPPMARGPSPTPPQAAVNPTQISSLIICA